ncbi:MAG: fatty acid desaturase [Cryomorphaceae bacterium]|jgi:fatty acid desaturase
MDASFARAIHVSPATLKSLKGRSNLRGWIQTGSHLGALGLCTYLLASNSGSFWAIPLFCVQGILINCLYAGVHELSHKTVFKTERLNEVFGRLFCFILLMGRDQDKFEHYQHHRHTQDVELDAEIVGGKPFTLFTYLLYFSGLSYWPGRFAEVFRLAAGQTERWPHLSGTQAKVVHKEARIMLVLYAMIILVSIALDSAALLTLWILPMLVMKWFHNLQNIVEHTGMPHEHEILVNTRTVSANPLMKWLFWNMPYHTAHHTYPMIPFHKLPQLHAAIVEKLGSEPPTVSHFGFQKHMIRKLWQEGTSAYTGKDIAAY